MSIKHIATKYSDYYKVLKKQVTEERQQCLNNIDRKYELAKDLHTKIKGNIEVYSDFGINLLGYKEFVDNTYITGKFHTAAKSLFINRKDNYNLVGELFELYNLAKYQKDIYNLNKELSKLDKILSLSSKEYNEILRIFYYKVIERMIKYGEGYSFEGCLGWLVINRCRLNKPRPKLDFAATKRNKEKLLAEGVELYDKNKEEWCRKNCIPYKATDYRVYLNKEYVYEIPLLNCSIPNGSKFRFECIDLRGAKLRGKTNVDILRECNSDIDKILALPLDMKTKLTICLEADKTLYTNFIRNENQEPLIIRKIDRQD